MKTFIRALAATLSCLLLLTMALWRYDAFPDLSKVTEFITATKDQLGKLTPTIDQALFGGSGAGQTARPLETGGTYAGYEPSEEIPEALLTAICNAYDDHKENVDVSAFNLTPEKLKAVVSEIRYSRPEYFYVKNAYDYTATAGVVKAFLPGYLCDAATAAKQTVVYEQTIAKIVEGAPNGSDFDKLLYLHDYFVKNYTYDYTYTIRDAYTFFQEKTGVCQAYMLAMIATTDALGIRSIPVTSDVMNHAWNLVELNGDWYHIDVTWDDVGSYPSYTSYAYFLQSDYGINAYDMAREGGAQLTADSKVHREWKTMESADNSKYDSATWRNSRSPITKLSGSYYCIVSGEDGADGAIWGGGDPLSMKSLFSVGGIWRLDTTSQYYVGNYSGLLAYDGELIYNTDSMIRAYNPATGRDRMVTIVSGLERGQSVFGVFEVSQDGKIAYVIASELRAESYAVGTATIS